MGSEPGQRQTVESTSRLVRRTASIMNKATFTLLYFMLCFYCLGASLMEHFAVDRAWIYAGPKEFPLLHHESGQGVLTVYVIPLICLTLFTVLMLWYRLPEVSKKWVWAGLLCHSVTWSRRLLFRYRCNFSSTRRRMPLFWNIWSPPTGCGSWPRSCSAA